MKNGGGVFEGKHYIFVGGGRGRGRGEAFVQWAAAGDGPSLKCSLFKWDLLG